MFFFMIFLILHKAYFQKYTGLTSIWLCDLVVHPIVQSMLYCIVWKQA